MLFDQQSQEIVGHGTLPVGEKERSRFEARHAH